MEQMAFTKLFKLRDKLQSCNSQRRKIEEMDRSSKYRAETMHHMQ